MGYTHYWTYKNPTIALAKYMNQESDIYKLDYDQREDAYKSLPDKNKIIKRIENHVTAFKAIAKDVQLIVDEARKKGIVICGGLGEGEPNISQTNIWLNGDGSKDLDHETFAVDLFDIGRFNTIEKLKNDEIWAFCKTAHKPYDLVVCASLMAIKHHLKSDFEVSSDGSIEYGEWDIAIKFYEELFNRKVPKQLMNYLQKETA